MEVIKGTSRIAIVGDKHTIKIPNIKISTLVKVFKLLAIKNLKHNKARFKNNLQFWYSKNFDNIKANIREYQLGKQYPEVVMKTRLSLLGILNIQETGEVISDEERDLLWKMMIKNSSNHNNIVREGHTFYERNNFARNKNGEIRLIDAGSYTMNNTLQSEGENISKAIKSI